MTFYRSHCRPLFHLPSTLSLSTPLFSVHFLTERQKVYASLLPQLSSFQKQTLFPFLSLSLSLLAARCDCVCDCGSFYGPGTKKKRKRGVKAGLGKKVSVFDTTFEWNDVGCWSKAYHIKVRINNFCCRYCLPTTTIGTFDWLNVPKCVNEGIW